MDLISDKLYAGAAEMFAYRSRHRVNPCKKRAEHLTQESGEALLSRR